MASLMASACWKNMESSLSKWAGCLRLRYGDSTAFFNAIKSLRIIRARGTEIRISSSPACSAWVILTLKSASCATTASALAFIMVFMFCSAEVVPLGMSLSEFLNESTHKMKKISSALELVFMRLKGKGEDFSSPLMRVQQTEHEPPSKVLPWLYSQNLNLALTWFQNTSTWPVIGEEESWDLLPPLGASSFVQRI